jgi:hypothetical protein
MLRTVVEGVESLKREDRLRLYDLFKRYYRAISFERFDRDLSNKDSVFLIHDGEGRLCGFSTLAVSSMPYACVSAFKIGSDALSAQFCPHAAPMRRA